MMRSLWTAATGMIAQQTHLDVTANNLSNINTTGYKKETAEFKTLLYQTIRGDSYDTQGHPKPVGVQVGLGVRNSAITSQFVQGPINETGNTWDFALEGDGFFQVRLSNGETGYTRCGALIMAVSNNGMQLTTSEGYPILDTTGRPVEVGKDIQVNNITIDNRGNLYYPNAETKTPESMGIQIGLVQFNNPSGLFKQSGSIYTETAASGEPLYESQGETFKLTLIHQKYLEMSNVQAADEMVNMIISQRAYEMNSKAITASDEMLQQANNLRR